MSVEKILTDELRALGSGLKTPPPPAAADLVRRAEKSRTRSRLRAAGTVVLAAAAVLAVVLVGGQLNNPDGAPSPAPQPTELPTGEPPQIPYVKDSKLYLGGQVRPGVWVSVVTAGSSSIGNLDESSDLMVTTMVLFRRGLEKERISTVSFQQPALLSPDGTKAVWVERDGGAWYLVERDMISNGELGRLHVGAAELAHVGAESEAWESLFTVTDDGTVSYGGVVSAHTWKPGHAPVDHDPETFNPDVDPSGYPPDAAYVATNPSRTWGAWTEDLTGQQTQGGTVTPDRYVVRLFAQKPGEPESRIQFELPRNSNAGGADWESDDSFLVRIADEPTGSVWHYVRCIIATKRCEIAPTP